MSRFSPVSVACCLLLGFAVGLGSLKVAYENMSWRDIAASIVLGQQTPEERWELLEGKVSEGFSSMKESVSSFIEEDVNALYRTMYGIHPDFDMTAVTGEQTFSVSAPTIFSMIPLGPEGYEGFTIDGNSTYSVQNPNWYSQKAQQDINFSVVLDETDTLDIGGQMVIDASDIFMKLDSFAVDGFENMPEAGFATASVSEILGSWIKINVEQESIMEPAEIMLTMQQLITKMEKHFEMGDMIKTPAGKKNGEWYVYLIELNDEQFKTSLEAFLMEAETELVAMGMTTDMARESITESWDGFSAFYQFGALASHVDNLDHWKAQLLLGPDQDSAVQFLFDSNTDYMGLYAKDRGGELFSLVLDGESFEASIPENNFVMSGKITDTQIMASAEYETASSLAIDLAVPNCDISLYDHGSEDPAFDCIGGNGGYGKQNILNVTMERKSLNDFWRKGSIVHSEQDIAQELIEKHTFVWDVTDEAFNASLVVPQTTFDEEWNLVETIVTYSLSGTYSDSGMMGEVSVDDEQMLNFAFEKDVEDIYSGSIQVPSIGMELVVEQYKSNSTADQYHTEGIMKLLMGGQSLIDMSLSGTMRSVDSVDIQLPTEYMTLEELMNAGSPSAVNEENWLEEDWTEYEFETMETEETEIVE